MALERRRAVFSGHVQGVGFRATCKGLARGFDVVGFVRNLPGGPVEVMAEGDDAELDRFLEAIRSEMGGFIRSFHVEPEPVGSPPLDGFQVRF